MIFLVSFSFGQLIEIDDLGQVISETYPDGTVVTYTRDPVGNILFTSVVNSITLPVELLSFEAYPNTENGNKSDLEWTTATEINSDFFEVQHSSNGLSFQTVGKVKASGNSNTTIDYDFVHNDPIIGLNYYRLRIVDFDGSEEYSNVQIVKFTEELSFSINVFPNPTDLDLFVKISENISPELLGVFDMNGKLINLPTTEIGINNWKIDVSTLTDGMYNIVLMNEEDRITRMFIKKK